MLIRKRKELIREFCLICEAKAPGSRFDRFFIDEFSKKLKKFEEVENAVVMFRAINDT